MQEIFNTLTFRRLWWGRCYKLGLAFVGGVVVQLLTRVQIIETPCSAAYQAPLFFTVFRSLLKFKSVESVMLSDHLILCCPLLRLPSIFPSIRVFSNSQLFASDGQRIGASALVSILPMNIQGWYPSGLTVLLSFQSKGLSRVLSSTTVWKHQFFSAQPSL